MLCVLSVVCHVLACICLCVREKKAEIFEVHHCVFWCIKKPLKVLTSEPDSHAVCRQPSAITFPFIITRGGVQRCLWRNKIISLKLKFYASHIHETNFMRPWCVSQYHWFNCLLHSNWLPHAIWNSRLYPNTCLYASPLYSNYNYTIIITK